MWLASAFLLGLAGSLHCVGMCGPLVMLIPNKGGISSRWFGQRLAHQLGRIAVYASLGAVVAALGQGIALAGWQQSLSVFTGVLLLFFVLWPIASEQFLAKWLPFSKLYTSVKKQLPQLLQKKGLTAHFGLGIVNGFLPCGLVYIALAAALVTADALHGAAYMAAFGAGSVPALLAVAAAGNISKWQHTIKRLMPAAAAAMAVLLILRGLELGIPYVSPILTETISLQAAPSCH
jgi:sulfite exporter TauE/SafE